jgi:hypothetical protein
MIDISMLSYVIYMFVVCCMIDVGYLAVNKFIKTFSILFKSKQGGVIK